jgi:DNA modification methylase
VFGVREGDVSLHYSDDSITLWHGDALDVLRGLGDESVNCVVTSPPYYGLRDYGEPGQYGLEPTPAEYVEQMRQVFAEVRRVLAVDGTLWLNLGDTYATRWSSVRSEGGGRGARVDARGRTGANASGVGEKNLLGIPWRVAFALQDDGWILRNHIVWHKPNAMPESVTDRLSGRHESLFLFARAPRYWFDLDPIREPFDFPDYAGAAAPSPITDDPTPYPVDNPQRGRARTGRRRKFVGAGSGRNPGDVWSVATQPFTAAHFAVMPPTLAERCILAGCRPSGTVLDPFAGSGTTGMVALKHGRRFVGIDLSAKYLDLALKTRLAQTALIEESS